MNEEMKFPKTFEEFIKQYSFFDNQQVYTNGSELIPVFRIKQWEEHKEKENQELKKQVEEINKMIEKCGFVNIEQVMLNYCGLLTQQKEFINYLQEELNVQIQEESIGCETTNKRYILEEILQKYKSIIGD